MFEREYLEALPALSESPGMEERGNLAASRYLRPDKAEQVGPCDDLGELRRHEWKDRNARQPQLSLVSAKHKFDVGLSSATDDLEPAAPGQPAMELGVSLVLGRYDCDKSPDWKTIGQPHSSSRLPYPQNRSKRFRDHPGRRQEAH